MSFSFERRFHNRDHPFRTSTNFRDFWPLPPSVSIYLLLSVGKFGKRLTPPPLRKVLNGWSHTLCQKINSTHHFPLYWSELYFWKIEFEKSNSTNLIFLSISNLDFAGKKLSLSNLIFQTRFFKSQVQINRGKAICNFIFLRF